MLCTDDVISARLALMKNEIDCAAVIFYPQPVAYVESRAVKRAGFVSKTLANDGGNEFLCVLPRTVIVSRLSSP